MSHQAVTELLCFRDGLLYSLLSNTQGDCECLSHTVSWDHIHRHGAYIYNLSVTHVQTSLNSLTHIPSSTPEPYRIRFDSCTLSSCWSWRQSSGDNVSIGWIALNFCADIYSSLKMTSLIPNDFFYSTKQNLTFVILSEMACQLSVMDCHHVWYRYPCFPQGECKWLEFGSLI